MFDFLRPKKGKYPVHHEDHALFHIPKFKSENTPNEKIHNALDYVNKSETLKKKQFTTIKYSDEVVLVLGNYRGICLLKKSHGLNNKEYSWDVYWLAYTLNTFTTNYEWNIRSLPSNIEKMTFCDIMEVTENARTFLNESVGTKYEIQEIS